MFQVFHICEGGKKISFLCPNGTIFQQTELICDWWFKVNCAASPGHYAESSEILSRARQVARDKDNKPKQAVNATNNDQRSKKFSKLSDELEDNYDFEDISLPLSNQPNNALNIDREGKASKLQENSKSNESQEFAASSSFVGGGGQPNFNGYYYMQPNGNKAAQSTDQRAEVAPVSTTTATPPTTTTTITTTTATATLTVTRGSPAQDPNVQSDGAFNGYHYREPERTARRFQTARPPKESEKPSSPQKFQTTPATPVTVPHRGTTKYRDNVNVNPLNKKHTEVDPNRKPFIIKVADPVDQEERPVPTTPSSFNRNEFTQSPTRYETPRTTPFYTPTVPSIVTTRATFSNRFGNARPPANSNKVAEHAMEMMRTIKDLKLDAPPQVQSATESDDQAKRSGLVIPPSSGPQTLHSLALYFATAVDSLVTKPADVTTKPLSPMLANIDARIGNITKLEGTLVSEHTQHQYETLFGTDKLNALRTANQKEKKAKNIDLRGNDANQLNDETKDRSSHDTNDLETEFSNNPIIAAAGTKQIRELAQVFTHALSAYLHDPSTFRKVLAEIRPTEPPPIAPPQRFTQNHNARNSRTKEFDDNAAYYTTTQSPLSATTTTEEFEVLDFSDVTLSTPASKEQLFDSSNEGTTTSSAATTTVPSTTISDAFDSTRSQILEDSLKHIDHVPASRVLTQPLESFAINQYNGNSLLDGTTEPSNPLAIEINGGLSEGTTNYPYLEELDNIPVQFNESTNFLSNRFDFVNRKNSTDRHQNNGNLLPPTTTTEYPNYGTTILPPLFPPFDLMQPDAVNSAFSAPNNDIQPPIDDDDLQRAHSQSIYGNGKNDVDHRQGKEYLLKNQADFGPLKTKNGHYITEVTSNGASAVTPNPNLVKTTLPDSGRISSSTWSTSYTVFLDPLTINDGLMGSNEQNTVTPSINTYLPQSTPTTPYDSFETTTFAAVTDRRKGKSIGTTTTTTTPPQTTDDYMQVMQRKANQMFGSLNDTSADHLMNVMKKADRNKTVRRLILLLVQTCDDNVDYNKTVEQTRKALLSALISMDNKIPDENDIQIIHSNSLRQDKGLSEPQYSRTSTPVAATTVPSSATTSTQLPITTYHRSLSARIEQQTYSTPLPQQYAFGAETTTTTTFPQSIYSTNYPTTTDLYTTTNFEVDDTTTTSPPSTTTYYPTTAYPTTTTYAPAPTTIRQRSQAIRQSNRLAKDLDAYLENQDDSNFNVNQSHRHSDARALELLRSLYSLAGRFGK